MPGLIFYCLIFSVKFPYLGSEDTWVLSLFTHNCMLKIAEGCYTADAQARWLGVSVD